MCGRRRADILILFGLLIVCMFTGCSDDDPPENILNPSQSRDEILSPPAITVVVDPPPGSRTHQETVFRLRFNREVTAVTFNGTPATGSERDWKVRPDLPQGTQTVNIKWTNRDGSMDATEMGPYEVALVAIVPPSLTSGTVVDGEVNVDPAPINVHGLEVHFDENVAGTLKLTDEAGTDLHWIVDVAGPRAWLTPVAGRELVNGTTYRIDIDVQDVAGNPLQTTITFVTKPK